MNEAAASDRNGATAAAGETYRPGYALVAERLLKYIAEENLVPGDRLPTESGLADLLGTSRNVAREAVKVLAAVGRLSVRRGAGIFVAGEGASGWQQEIAQFQPTEMEHVLMLLDYRYLIEGETARRAATQATPIQVSAIASAAKESSAAVAGPLEAFAEADAKFHTSVGIAANNVFLQSSIAAIRTYSKQIDVLLLHGAAPGSLEDAGRQHEEIARAISSGDSDGATRLMTDHIDTTRRQLERKIRDRLFALQSGD